MYRSELLVNKHSRAMASQWCILNNAITMRFMINRFILGLLFHFRIFNRHSDSLTPYHTCPKFWTSPFYYLCLKIVCWVAHRTDPDQRLHSDLGLHCSNLFVWILRVKTVKILINAQALIKALLPNLDLKIPDFCHIFLVNVLLLHVPQLVSE